MGFALQGGADVDTAALCIYIPTHYIHTVYSIYIIYILYTYNMGVELKYIYAYVYCERLLCIFYIYIYILYIA